MVTTNNTPDIAIGDTQHRLIYAVFYVVISIFNLVMESGLILAFVNRIYRQVFEEEVAQSGKLNDYQMHLIE